MADSKTQRYDDFDALMARHQGLVRRLCWWYAGGRADCVADLLQEVTMHLWHCRHTLRAGSTARQERAWVRFHCRSVFEHQRRRPGLETVELEEALHVAVDDEGLAETIDRLSTDLTDTERRVLELVLDGYTDGEIGSLLQVGTKEAGRLHTVVLDKMKRKAKEI